MFWSAKVINIFDMKVRALSFGASRTGLSFAYPSLNLRSTFAEGSEEAQRKLRGSSEEARRKLGGSSEEARRNKWRQGVYSLYF
ncbi:hypothetical protein [Capnocytophaga bilenii]